MVSFLLGHLRPCGSNCSDTFHTEEEAVCLEGLGGRLLVGLLSIQSAVNSE
jgi:hypothetical protein